MTEPPLNILESRLSKATTWAGPTTQLWKTALATQTKTGILSFDVFAFARRRWFPLTVCGSAACLAIVVFATSSVRTNTPVLLSSAEALLRRNASPSAETVKMDSAGEYTFQSQPTYGLRLDRAATTSKNYAVDGMPPESTDAWPLVQKSGVTPGQFNSPSQTDPPQPATDTSASYRGPTAPVARHVIHKATIELTTPDVRAAFLKAGLILNEALGEHVQDSSLTGTGNDATGALTLRVVASRLSDVCNALRDLGVVVSERREGQDVTGQVIDVEARLRNEQRVEKELLELFDQRKDAPLKDVLDLRQKLSEVRAGIEQLVAQRDQLSRLVSLATVLVIIRTGEKPPEEPKVEGLWHYFGESIQRAWRAGLRGLADTIAALVSIFIGGLIWWILLIVALLLMRRYVRSRKA